jgi:hypothetical protein
LRHGYSYGDLAIWRASARILDTLMREIGGAKGSRRTPDLLMPFRNFPHRGSRTTGGPKRGTTRVAGRLASIKTLADYAAGAKRPRTRSRIKNRAKSSWSPTARPFAPFSPPAQTRSHATDGPSQRPPADPPEQRAPGPIAARTAPPLAEAYARSPPHWCAPERRASLASGPDTPHCAHASADPSAGSTRPVETITSVRDLPRPPRDKVRVLTNKPPGVDLDRSRRLVPATEAAGAAPAHHPSGCWISAGRAPRSRSDNLIISTTERHAALPYQGSGHWRPKMQSASMMRAMRARLCRKWLKASQSQNSA